MTTRAKAFSQLAKNVSGGVITADGLGGGVGLTTYDSAGSLPISGLAAGDQAFTLDTGRLYISNGSGWYNIALINATPNITSIQDSDGGTTPFVLSTTGEATTITITATDSDGDTLTYTAYPDSDFNGLASISQSTNEFTITPFGQDSVVAESGTITFKVSDGINLASSAAQTFILTFLSPLWDETVLSIGTSSTDGLANSTFIDRSTNAHTVTAAGTPLQTPFHPYLDNWSVEFDGTNSDYIRFDNSTNALYSSSNDITIECWIYPRTTTVTGIFDGSSLVADGLRQFRPNRVGKHSSTDYDVEFTITPFKWQHFAFVADSTNWRVYIDGVQQNTISATSYTARSTFDIGTINAGGASKFNGYISDFRITKSGVYTSNFTPPSKLEEITNTTLLVCNSNRFINRDTSYSGSITVNGDPEISAFNPFGQEPEYAVGENKGSFYKYASNDYLTGPVLSTLQDNDWTIEFWLWLDNQTLPNGRGGIVGIWSGGSGRSWTIYISTTAMNIQHSENGSNAIDNESAISINYDEWNHFVFQKNGTNKEYFLNGQPIAQHTYSSWINSSRNLTIGMVDTSYGSWLGNISDFKLSIETKYDYATGFTPPTSPVGNTNASLYLPMDNAGIFDKTGLNILTTVSDPVTETSVKKYDNSSIDFDIDDSVEVVLSGPIYRSIPGDFTFESWVKLNAQSDAYKFLFWWKTSDVTKCLQVRFGDSEDGYHLQFLINVSGAAGTVYNIDRVQSDFTGDFHHIAWTRTNGVNRVFFDGTQMNVATGTNPSTFSSSSWTDSTEILLPIGISFGGVEFYYGLQGNLEGIQWFNGYSKYTQNFTPPNRTQGITYQATS